MERDAQGREVRHVPPPGHRPPELDEDAWPTLEQSPYTFEGEIEQLGVLARRVNARRRWPAWVRVAGWLIAAALLLPLVIGVISMIAGEAGG